jgi:hypothetical protein
MAFLRDHKRIHGGTELLKRGNRMLPEMYLTARSATLPLTASSGGSKVWIHPVINHGHLQSSGWTQDLNGGDASIYCWNIPQNLQRRTRTRSSSKAPVIPVNIHPNPKPDVKGPPEDKACMISSLRISSATETPNAVRCA